MDKKYQDDFISFQAKLKSYLYRLVVNKQEAEDIAQETYIKASQNIDQFKRKSNFKTWVFAIATNLAKDSLRANTRWGEDWMDRVKDVHRKNKSLMAKKLEIVNNSAHGTFVMSEHLNYCFSCTSKTLLLINQICLLLKEVYEFRIAEIMQITSLSEGKVKHALADSRKNMSRIFENKCVLINKQGVCSQCTGLNNLFNPKQNAQKEANKLKIVKERRNKNYEQLLDLRFQMLKSIDPLAGKGVDLHNYLLENSPKWAAGQIDNSIENQ